VVAWGIETVVRKALRSHPAPSGVPPCRLFVPESVRSRVLQWGHNSQFACHPGVHLTFTFLARRFWWPTMRNEVKDFLLACPICAHSKASHRAPTGLLQPLPVPSRPWSHVALDCVSGLPSSQGKTVILTVVDRFSKGVHLVALPKLPSASETVHLLMSQVFRLHGLPQDVVSDRGPQFTSQVWQAFFKGLGASVSLSSGYHPQTNGEDEPERGVGTPLCGCQEPILLESVPSMGRVLHQLPGQICHGFLPLRGISGVPATAVFPPCRPIWTDVVASGRSPEPPYSKRPNVATRGREFGCTPRIFPYSWPPRSWVPVSWAPSRSRGCSVLRQ